MGKTPENLYKPNREIYENLISSIENSKTHPHSYLGEFVNNYNLKIKPVLETGNVDLIRELDGIITEQYIIFEGVSRRSHELKSGVLAFYEASIINLDGLTRERISINENIIQYVLSKCNLYISKIELIMQGDELYDAQITK